MTIVHHQTVKMRKVQSGQSQEKREIKRTDRFMLVNVPIFSSQTFRENFRVTRQAFNWLHEKVAHHLKTFFYGPQQLSAEKQLLASIWILSTPESDKENDSTVHQIGTLFKLSQINSSHSKRCTCCCIVGSLYVLIDFCHMHFLFGLVKYFKKFLNLSVD